MNRRCLRVVAALPLLLSQLWAAPSYADPATAEALFVEGRSLLEAGRYAEACAKLAESLAQDPASGTAINLALCFEKQDKLASAWAHYRVAASLARRDAKAEREAAAEAKVRELEPRLPRLTITTLQRVPELEVTWGELKLGGAALGSAIPIDAGEHDLIVKAPGYHPLTQLVVVKDGESRRVLLPVLVPLAASPGPTPLARTVASPVRETARSTAMPTSALVLGGTGLALFAVGTYFGVSALSSYGTAGDLCPARHGCTDEALAARAKAGQRAWVANIALGAGLLASGGAVFLWLSNRHEPKASASISVSQQGARLAFGTRF